MLQHQSVDFINICYITNFQKGKRPKSKPKNICTFEHVRFKKLRTFENFRWKVTKSAQRQKIKTFAILRVARCAIVSETIDTALTEAELLVIAHTTTLIERCREKITTFSKVEKQLFRRLQENNFVKGWKITTLSKVERKTTLFERWKADVKADEKFKVTTRRGITDDAFVTKRFKNDLSRHPPKTKAKNVG